MKSQYFALSFSPTYIPSTFFFKIYTYGYIYSLLDDSSFTVYMILYCVYKYRHICFLTVSAALSSGLNLYFGYKFSPESSFYSTPFRRFTQFLKKVRLYANCFLYKNIPLDVYSASRGSFSIVCFLQTCSISCLHFCLTFLFVKARIKRIVVFTVKLVGYNP